MEGTTEIKLQFVRSRLGFPSALYPHR